MLRVAEHGVILINHNNASTNLESYIKSDSYRGSYEEVDNFL